MFGRKKNQIQMTLDQCLASAVVPNPQVTEKDLPDGRIELTLPYLKPWLVRKISRKGKTFPRRFELDEVSADLWRQIDGKRTVADMVDYMAQKGDTPPDQAQESVLNYMNMLLTRGLIGLAVPRKT